MGRRYMDLGMPGNSSLEYDESIFELIVRGVEVYYSSICLTKLWLFSRNLGRETENSLVEVGKLLHNKYFKNKIKNILFDNIVSIDFITRGNRIIIHEVKHSDIAQEADELQVSYYIFYLLNKGVERVYGIIHYPKKRKTIKVYLSKDRYQKLKDHIKLVNRIKSIDSPPKPKKNRFCKRCSYRDFCWV